MRLIDILATASSNTFRSKLRTTLTIIAIFIGAFTLTLTNGLGSGISTYLDKQIDGLGAKDILIVQSARSANAPSDNPKEYDPSKKVAATGFGTTAVVLTDADIAKIKKTNGVIAVETNLVITPDFISGANGKKFQLSINPYVTGSHLDLSAGDQLNNSSSQKALLLPTDYVATLGYSNAQEAVGKPVTVGISDAFGQQHTVDAVVAGVMQKSLTAGGGVQTNQALTNALYANQIIGLPASATNSYQAVIARFDAKSTPAQIQSIKDALKKQGYQAQTVEDSIGTFKAVINGIIIILNAFAVIALLAASFGIINTLLMSVQERTKEIGLMKAMGMSGSRIFLLFSTEAVMLGFWGSFIGVIMAMIVGNIINSIVSNGILKDLVGLQLLAFPIGSVAVIIGIVMVIAFLAGTLPAFRAARQSPIDSLRYE